MANLHILVGRICQDPETRFSAAGMQITKFSIACNRKGKDGADYTQFIPVVCFGKLAELVDTYQKKGSQVFVQGEGRIESYENKDGVKMKSYSVAADRVEFLGSKSDNQGQQKNSVSYPNQERDPFPPSSEEEGIPF